MKGLKISFIVFAAALITIGLGGAASAFHSGGVAECVGCHALHDAQSESSLLTGTDASSTCLECHGAPGASSYHIATPDADMPAGTPPGNRTPGGDFGWLKKSYTWSPRSGTTENEAGDTHGHNIVAADFTYDADGTNLSAPGGSMDADKLSCISCHDQHGRLRRLASGSFAVPAIGSVTDPIFSSGSYNTSPDPASGKAVGAYRLLRGPGSGAGGEGNPTFSAVFNAVVPSTYNRSESVSPTRVAYGAGITAWCVTCHADMDSGVSAKHTHPVNQGLGTTVTNNYNAYRGSGILNGTSANSYDSIVPFQTDNSTDYSTLKSQASYTVLTGPGTGDRVMCLSCHRAHASGWMYGLRWDNEIELIAVEGEWPGTDAATTEGKLAKWAKARTQAERTKAYNDKPASSYATFQRSLCNKCHAKD